MLFFYHLNHFASFPKNKEILIVFSVVFLIKVNPFQKKYAAEKRLHKIILLNLILTQLDVDIFPQLARFHSLQIPPSELVQSR